MTPELMALLGRIAERSAAWALAALLLFFAFRLSTTLTSPPVQSAEFKWKDFFIKLTRISPGVFFAVLGTIIVATNLRSPLEVTARRAQSVGEKMPAGRADELHIEYLGGEASASPVEICVTINRLEQFANLLNEQACGDEAVREVRNAAASLATYRPDILAPAFGRQRVLEFQKNPRAISQTDQTTYNAFQRAFYSSELRK